MKRLGLILVLIFVVIFTVSCAKKEEKKLNLGKKNPKKITIGIAMANLEGDGYKTLKKVLEQEGKKKNITIELVSADNDPLEQEMQVDKLLRKNIKVLVLNIVDPDLGQQIVERALRRKVKVIALERLPKNTGLDAYIAPDYYRAGELQGEYVAKQVESGLVYIFAGDQDEKSSKELMDGAKKGLAANPRVTTKTVNVSDKVDPQLIEMQVERFLSENPLPQGIIAQTGAQTVALVKHYLDPTLADKVVTVGIGADLNSTKGMLADLHDAEVDTRPDLLARQVLTTVRKLVDGDVIDFDTKIKNDESDVPAKILPVRLIKKDNVYLLEERWGKLGELKDKGEKMLEEEQKEEEGMEEEAEGEEDEGKEEEEKVYMKQEDEEEQGGEKESTTLKITTEDGREMEVKVPGKVKEVKGK